jgi:2'-5' RNA ligase
MRLFIAVGIGHDVRSAASRVRASIEAGFQQLRSEPPKLVWVAPQALHLTLRFLGELPDDRVPAIAEAIQAPFPCSPFTITWHGLGAFPTPRRPRAIWLGVKVGARQLGELEVEVARRLGGLAPGEAADVPKPFHPHLTLARVKTESRAVDWPAVLEATPVADVTSRVEHVSLMRSRGLPGGAGYEEIGRGRLGG